MRANIIGERNALIYYNRSVSDDMRRTTGNDFLVNYYRGLLNDRNRKGEWTFTLHCLSRRKQYYFYAC